MKKSKTLAIVMDPIHTIKPHKDTSLALLLAFQRAEYQIFYLERQDLEIRAGRACGHAQELRVADDSEQWYSFTSSQSTCLELGSLDIVLMRLDPPVDSDFHMCLQILDLAEKQGALVVNRPASIMRFNEKLLASHFPEHVAHSLVSQRKASLSEFVNARQMSILKPLDGMGGMGIFKVAQDDANLDVIIEQLTHYGRDKIMAQTFMPEIKDGDKRILLIDGEPVPYALARIPSAGKTRGNIAAGGTGRPQPLSDQDWKIAAAVGPYLKAHGLLFVGLDVIGDKITEVNVTSPTCAREIDRAYDTKIGALLVTAAERLLKSHRSS